MLYLGSADTNGSGPAEPVPLAELTAVGLERALLAADRDARTRELHAALGRDPAVAGWVTRTAAAQTGVLSPSLHEAVKWFADRLETELEACLIYANGSAPQRGVELRLPALARRLVQCERQLIDADARLERAKLESLKELAYGASHEINNPLANIAARAQTLLDDEADPERQRKLIAIHRQAMRAHEMIADLMLFARPPKLNRAECDILKIVQQVADELREIAEEQGTTLNCMLSDQPIVLSADDTQLAVAIHALVTNSLEALGEGGMVTVGVRKTEAALRKSVEIAIGDDGPGIPDEIRAHMFDPFFSGREAGRGLGFGLSKSWRIVTDHGGDLVVGRPAEGGTELIIRLPLDTTTPH
jgi:signal transduction histidine kinase